MPKAKYNWGKLDIDFASHLEDCLREDTKLSGLIKYLLPQQEVFIFGGMIRDFVLQKGDIIVHKDIDLVVDNMNDDLRIMLVDEYKAKFNSFGGYKFKTDANMVDLWNINKTWAIDNGGYLDMMLKQALPKTAFFNVTAAIYSVNNKKVICSREFINGIDNNLLEIVLEHNPIRELCIIKSMEYYYGKGFKIGDELSNYIFKSMVLISSRRLVEFQIENYGDVSFDENRIGEFIRMLEKKKKYRLDMKTSEYFKMPNPTRNLWDEN